MWAIANEDPEPLRALRDREGFEFPILLDPEGEVIRAWGLLNDQDSRGRTIPHPTVVIFDRDGRVSWSLTETNYRLRPPASELIERLRALPPAQGEVEGADGG